MRRGGRLASRARAPARRWEVVIRAYDDGVAFRYRLAAQEGWDRFAIAGERTRFHLPGDALAYVLPLNGYTTSHEAHYQKRAVGEIPGEWLLGLPLLAELPAIGWLAVMEANLTDYAGMYLARDAEGGAVLGSGYRQGRASQESPSGPAFRTSRPGGSS